MPVRVRRFIAAALASPGAAGSHSRPDRLTAAMQPGSLDGRGTAGASAAGTGLVRVMVMVEVSFLGIVGMPIA